MTTYYETKKYSKLQEIPAHFDPRFPENFVERLWKVRDFIEESPEHNFDMSDWGDIDADLSSEHCGSPACLAGFIAVLAFKDPDGPKVDINDCCSTASLNYLFQYAQPENDEHGILKDSMDDLYLTCGSIMQQAYVLPVFGEDSNPATWPMSEVKKKHILAILDAILDGTIDPFIKED